MFNKAVLMGRICNELELKTIQGGISVLSFRLAVDRSYQPKGEERKADFFNIVAWRSTAEFIARYFGKGRMILVEGELQTRQYVDRNNVTQNIVELVVNSAYFTGEPKSSGNYGAYPPPPPPVPNHTATESAAPAVSTGSTKDFAETDSDDGYPF